MFEKKAKGGIIPKTMENLPKICRSKVPIETAFDNCADGCPKFQLAFNPGVLIVGDTKLRTEYWCEHMGFARKWQITCQGR